MKKSISSFIDSLKAEADKKNAVNLPKDTSHEVVSQNNVKQFSLTNEGKSTKGEINMGKIIIGNSIKREGIKTKAGNLPKSVKVTNGDVQAKESETILTNQKNDSSFIASVDDSPTLFSDNIPLEESAPLDNDESPNLKEIQLADKVTGYVNLISGELVTAFKSFDSNDFVIPVDITHIHRAGSGTKGYGTDWRLNLNKTLNVSSDDTSETTIYTYIDEIGDSYTFKETYYYLEAGKKTFISKDSVTIDLNGELTYSGKKVYKHQSCYGNTLISEINDYIDSDLIEQRQDERIQIEEYIKSCEENAKNYIVAKSNTGNKVRSMNIASKASYKSSISGVTNSSDNIIIAEGEAMQLRSLYESLEQTAIQKSQLERQLAQYNLQLDSFALQKNQLWFQCEQVNQQISDLDATIKFFKENGYSNKNVKPNDPNYASLNRQALREANEDQSAQKNKKLLETYTPYNQLSLITAQEKMVEQQKNSITKEINAIADQQTLVQNQEKFINEQINYIISQARKNLNSFNEMTVQYWSKKAELEQMIRQTPVNFIKDRNGIINGFNAGGNLVCMYDSYENYVMIEYNSHNQICGIYDSNKKSMEFEYENNLLHRITDNRGRRVNYIYDSNKLTSVVLYDESVLGFAYEDGKIKNIISSKETKTELIYDSAKLTEVKICSNDVTIGKEIILNSDTYSETLSSIAIEYSDNSTIISLDDGASETYNFRDNQKLSSVVERKSDGEEVVRSSKKINLLQFSEQYNAIGIDERSLRKSDWDCFEFLNIDEDGNVFESDSFYYEDITPLYAKVNYKRILESRGLYAENVKFCNLDLWGITNMFHQYSIYSLDGRLIQEARINYEKTYNIDLKKLYDETGDASFILVGDGSEVFIPRLKITTYIDAPLTCENCKQITTVESNNLNSNETITIEQYDSLDYLIRKEVYWQRISGTVRVKSVTEYEYDADYRLVSERTTKFTEENNSVTEQVSYVNYHYNAQGSLVLTESYVEGEELTSGKNIEEKVYDKKGNCVKTITYNSLDSSSKFYSESECAENGQVIAEKDETGENSAEYDYVDGTNVVNSVKYANGSKFAYGRNPFNNQVTSITQSTEEGESNTTDIVYQNDLAVELKSGNTVLDYEYDYKGRKTKVSVNGSTLADYSYTEYSKSDSKIDYGTQTETLYVSETESVVFKAEKTAELNAENKFIDKETATINDFVVSGKIYDPKKRLRNVTVFDGTDGYYATNYTYNNYDQPVHVSSVLKNSEVLNESYTYNKFGELSEKQIKAGDLTQAYTYTYKDNSQRQVDRIGIGNYSVSPLSDVNGRNTGKEIYGGESRIAGEYISYRKVGDHATNMPSTVFFGGNHNGFAIKDNLKYKYDKCGNIAEIRENGKFIVRYLYDSLNRLVREDNKVLSRTCLYEYDNNGNIVGVQTTSFTLRDNVDECAFTNDEYVYNGDRLVSFNGEHCEYNNAGNPTIYRDKPATWQYGKLLASYNGVNFVYDGQGRRVGKNDLRYTYDAEGNLITSSDGLEFIYDNSGVLGVKYNNEQYFYRKDAQGNIIALLDEAGNVVVKYVYDAWGNHAVLDSEGNNIIDDNHIGNINPFRYRGYYFDTETGFYYLQTRYYDPETGRFISQDSIEYADPETINGLNLYAYCGNNPVMFTDSCGTSKFLDFLKKLGRFFVGGILANIGASIALVTAIPALFIPGISAATQFGFSMMMYGGFVMGSVFDSQIYKDMNDIGWNPFNSNAGLAYNSGKVSFYMGVPIIRINDERSGTFGAIWLGTGDGGFNLDPTDLIRHEWGHVPQYIAIGLINFALYIAIPSATQMGRFAHYYDAPWEASASIMGGVHSYKYTTRQKWLAFGHLIATFFIGPYSYLFAIH